MGHQTKTEVDAAAHIGRSIRARRRELALTQEDLASLAGVSPRFLGELERGKPTVRLSALLSVSQALGLTVTVS
jgi:HTH-type transcriptional regulator/antitoxin HipB